MRKFMTSTLGAILALAGIAGSADAANFTNPVFGISIDVDDALSKQPQLRDIQYFKSEDKSGSLMIKQIHDLSVVEFLQELRDVGHRHVTGIRRVGGIIVEQGSEIVERALIEQINC